MLLCVSLEWKFSPSELVVALRRRIPLLKCRLRRIFFFLGVAVGAWAQPRWFAGGGPGLAILSGDAASAAAGPRVAFYDAGKGAIGHAFGGAHFTEYFSVQGAWSTNRHSFATTELSGANLIRRESATRAQHFAADAMVYFRDRRSWVRPYLAIGAGATHFSRFGRTHGGFRAAAGIEVLGARGWGLRYAFLETISANPISRSLNPAGAKSLMTFQNLFGAVKYW
jgi:hypothetical protein